jgi:thiol-disulfide isomerase/thioredoxin
MKINDIKQKVINTQSIVILFIVFLFIIAALFIYRRYITNRLNGTYVANNEYNSNKSGIESVDIYFFYTEWCPHCKTAKPIWNDFKNSMENTKINGIKLNFFEVDCDKNQEIADKYNVKGFPTIKMLKGNQIIEYDAKPSKDNLVKFVTTTLE